MGILTEPFIEDWGWTGENIGLICTPAIVYKIHEINWVSNNNKLNKENWPRSSAKLITNDDN